MKIAISLPDDIFTEAEQLAAELHCSRSQLYSRAVQEYVARHSADKVTEALNATFSDGEDRDLDFPRAAAAHTLEQSEW